jgi:PIN domain nuclease of toxin-antitoxin system
MIVLDTHVLLWMDQNSNSLGGGARERIDQAWCMGEVMVSAISFWECAMLVEKGRVVLPCSTDKWHLDLIDAGVKEVALDGRLALAAVGLNWDHRDPADRFIVATAIQLNATLLTADEKILAWRGALPRVDARR